MSCLYQWVADTDTDSQIYSDSIRYKKLTDEVLKVRSVQKVTEIKTRNVQAPWILLDNDGCKDIKAWTNNSQ